MSNTRKKDIEWNCVPENGVTYESAQLAVLMDLRDELKRLNALLYCENFTDIPMILRKIQSNTSKPRHSK